MNNVLELKGKRFVQASKVKSGGGPSMKSDMTITSDYVRMLIAKLNQIKEYWLHEYRPFKGILISVYYNKIVAKSNRIAGIFRGSESNNAVVGAKFNQEKNKHIITYYISSVELDSSINLLCIADKILLEWFKGGVTKTIFDNKNLFDGINYSRFGTSRSMFRQVLADISYIDTFEVEIPDQQFKESIITLYDTGMDTKQLFHEIGIDILSSRILDNRTVFLDESQLKILFEKVPYLVSMATENISDLMPEDFINQHQKESIHIPAPSNEPTIGVIDTLFDKRVYFNEWVEYHDMVDPNIKRTQDDYCHGTEVSSIIVDGHRLNPWLDDGCGRFKVRHFGVATGSRFSSFTIIKLIKQIIAENNDIKVWNISLGSNQEINDNFISAEAAVLDQIQFENDVIFVVAGTNKPNESIKKIGSPADSINSVVVNSVTKSGLKTNYSRIGLALSFFAKPDVSYYGGSEEQYIKVCGPLGLSFVAGTSFAAPWIARKLSYLIDVLGLNKEVAKAMIIDSARGWREEPSPEEVACYGHGIVPIKINDIIQTKDDEIRFIVTDISEKWNTYNYDFPVPLKNDRYPYYARATMCYFPMCDRTQGVDYTNTELNLHIGPIGDNEVKDIKGDRQNQDDTTGITPSYILEGEARKKFRKWDNVKYISETIKERKVPKKSYEKNKNWGIEVKTNNRLDSQDGVGLRFGIVVTLKEMFGVNRIDEFIRSCNLNGWIVNQIEINNRIDIREKIEEEIEFN